jgi:hypothetical protein
MVFSLNDAIEEREWRIVHTGVGAMVNALTTALGLLHNVVTPAGQV